MFTLLLKRFERLLHAYPDVEPTLPPKGFIAFIWAASQGARGYILLLAGLYARPGLENMTWGSTKMSIKDPFGNRLTFTNAIST